MNDRLPEPGLAPIPTWHWPFLHPPERADRIPAMTCCIAAICEGGKAVVLAADRFSWHPTASIEAEQEDRKFYFLSDQVALMGAGSSTAVEDVLRRLRATNPTAVLEIAAHCVDACQEYRRQEAETLHCKRAVGLSMADMRAAFATAVPGSIELELYSRIQNHAFGTHLIVAGIDHEGAHVRMVDDSGNISHSDLGYTAVGTGAVLACVSLARRAHKKSLSLPETLYNVFEAKKTGEMAKGVGGPTDMSILRAGQPAFDLPQRALDALQGAYERCAPPALSRSDIDAIAEAARPQN